jgi:exodeoxyribonuclease VII large subunit
MDNVFTVSELTTRIKALLERSFGFVWVTGEISNLRRPGSGHVYLTLKDGQSQVRAVMFRQSAQNAGFDLDDGMSVICRGRVSVYQPRGEYQLMIDTVEPKGIGALQLAFEQMKTRLEQEGLFDPSHKKQIPFLPRRIGIVTSPTGAAIRDILNVTARRFPSVPIRIAPVRVQGTEAPPEICDAITRFNAMNDVDVILVTRGGGSLEDLFCFNDERVARAIYASEIPVISAVGHEIDFTIADFVADLRAPTPSAAAELAVPMRKELVESVQSLHARLVSSNRIMRQRSRERVKSDIQRLPDPRRWIEDLRLKVDDVSDTLAGNLRRAFDVRRRRCESLGDMLKLMSPRTRIEGNRAIVENLVRTVTAGINTITTACRQRLHRDMAMLDMLSPLSVLDRGYAIVTKMPDQTIVKDAGAMDAGDDVRIRVSSGSFSAQVTEVFREKRDG